MLGGLVLVVVALLIFIRYTKKGGEQFPEQLGVLHKLETYENTNAQKLFAERYSTSVAPLQYSAVRYGSADGFATVFSLSYASEDDVARELEILQKRILQSQTRYSHLREFEYGKKRVYLFLGLGKAHYVVAGEKNLYWIESDVPTAQATIVRFVEFLNTK